MVVYDRVLCKVPHRQLLLERQRRISLPSESNGLSMFMEYLISSSAPGIEGEYKGNGSLGLQSATATCNSVAKGIIDNGVTDSGW